MLSNSKEYFHSHRKVNKIDRYYARQKFFKMIEEYTPEVLESLKNDVLPVYRKLQEKFILITKNNKKEFIFPDFNDIKHANSDYYSDLVPLKAILKEWSKKYGLFDDWIIECALETLTSWYSQKTISGKLVWQCMQQLHVSYSYPFSYPNSRNDLKIFFYHPGWDPVRQSQKFAKRKIINDFNQFLEKYFKKVSNLWGKTAMNPPIEKRKMEKHIYWLIEYQLHEKSYNDICNEESNKTKTGNIDESTIIKGITSMAELIGLTSRKKHL